MTDPIRPSAYRRQRMVRSGALVLAASIVQKVIGFVFIVVLARAVSLTDLGVYSFAIAYGTMFAVFGDLGIDMVTVRRLSSAPDAEHGEILGSAFLAKTVAVTITLAVGGLIAAFLRAELAAAAFFGAVVILTDIPGTLLLALSARLENVWPVAVKTLSLLAISLAVLGGAGAGMSGTSLVLIGSLVNVAATAVMTYLVRRRLGYQLKVNRAMARGMAREAAPLAVSLIAVVVWGRIDQILLGVIGTVKDVARYAVAVRLVEGLNILPVAVGTVALPALAHLEGLDPQRASRLVHRGYRYVAVGILPVAALGTAVGGPILGTLFGPAFRGSGTVLAVLLWAHFFGSSWVLGRQVLIAQGRGVHLAVLAVAAAVLNVVLNLALIPRHGAEGAAYATLVAYASPFFVAAIFPPIRPAFVVAFRAATRPAIAAALVLVPVSWAVRWGLAPALGVFVVVAPLAVFVTRSITPSEVKEMLVSFRSEGRPIPGGVKEDNPVTDGDAPC